MKKKILIVEDDLDIAEKLKDLLELEEYESEIATHGLHALNHLECTTVAPAVILLDLMMPVMDGIQFFQEKNRRPHMASTPVIVMTAGGNFEEKVKELGAFSYLRKPLDIDVLLTNIHDVLALTSKPAASSSCDT